MKKTLYLLFVFLFVFACSLPGTGQESMTEEVVPTQVADIAPPSATPLPTLPPPSPSFTAIPTLAPEATITPMPLPQQVLPSNVIRFAPGGTYADVQDNVASGAVRTYLLAAAKGQVMSVSVNGGYFPLQVQGQDGTVLCPVQNEECVFWRGTLPLSQDYYITVKSGGDQSNFILRVAVNPPGQSVQQFAYQNSSSGISLRYPDTFAPALPVVGNYKTEPELSLRYIDTKAFEKTNLSESYLFVSSTKKPDIVATCTEPNQNAGAPEQLIGTEAVNGYTFTHFTSEGAGAGNYYQQEIYRTVQNNTCYEVIYYIHSTNAGNYEPGTVTEFDRNAVLNELYGVFASFKIN